MAKVTDILASAQGVTVLCDMSPPRGAFPDLLDAVQEVDADFLCVAYSPGKSVRVDPAMTAYALRQRTGRDVVFNLSPRDKNRLAIQSHLLGAQLLGLDNVIVLQGDPFTPAELERVRPVNDYTATEAIAGVQALNQGMDFRGLKLRHATDFCVGATMDLNRDLEGEARLAHRKRGAGAQFFISQALFDLDRLDSFRETYRRLHGADLEEPVFHGLQVLEKDGLLLGDIPQAILDDLEGGRSGADIAAELWQGYVDRGARGIYLVPPILKGGRRDYAAAQRALETCRG